MNCLMCSVSRVGNRSSVLGKADGFAVISVNSIGLARSSATDNIVFRGIAFDRLAIASRPYTERRRHGPWEKLCSSTTTTALNRRKTRTKRPIFRRTNHGRHPFRIRRRSRTESRMSCNTRCGAAAVPHRRRAAVARRPFEERQNGRAPQPPLMTAEKLIIRDPGKKCEVLCNGVSGGALQRHRA